MLVAVIVLGGCVESGAFSVFVPAKDFRAPHPGECPGQCTALVDVEADAIFSASIQVGCHDWNVAMCVLSETQMSCNNTTCRAGVIATVAVSFDEESAPHGRSILYVVGDSSDLVGAWIAGVR